MKILTVTLKIYWISSLLKRKETQMMFLILEVKRIYNLSLGTVRNTVEYFVLPEMLVRYMSKTLGISYSNALEKVYKKV